MTPLLVADCVGSEGRLHPTSIEVGGGTLVALIGTNGSGKTSLLRCLAAIELRQGTVCIDGEDLSALAPSRRRRLLSFLPASRELVWPIKVRDVVALGGHSLDSERVNALLDALELTALADRPTNHLSTGERARVLLTRALVSRPRLLLLDEPLSNLDPYWVLKTIGLLRDMVTETGCSAIVSLHDIDKTESFDRVLLMDGGKLEADHPPTEMLNSEALSHSFRIERQAGGWRIRRPEDPRSSP